MSDEKAINPQVKILNLGYEDDGCTTYKKIVIKEISGMQMLKIVEVMEEATNRAEEIGMEHFKMAKNNMDLNQRLLTIGITHPKKSENEEEYALRIEENLIMIRSSPQKHIDEAVEAMLKMNDLQSFLAKNLLGVLQQIAFQVSVMAKKIMETENRNLEKSMKSSQKNTNGPSGK